jgi:hypothetical protein
MPSCTCPGPCEHHTATQSKVEAVGRQFAFLGPPTQVEQDENDVGGIDFFIPYTFNSTLLASDVLISGTFPTGLAATVGVNSEGLTSIRVTTPSGTVFVGGPYSTVFTVFGVATTVTIYATLQ